MEDNKLFSEFPPVSTEKWEEVINKDLKGADYEKKLVWKTIVRYSFTSVYVFPAPAEALYITKGVSIVQSACFGLQIYAKNPNCGAATTNYRAFY